VRLEHPAKADEGEITSTTAPLRVKVVRQTMIDCTPPGARKQWALAPLANELLPSNMRRRARCRHIIEADNSRTKDTLAQFSYPFGLHSFNCITPE
jgi:hypothetical protein